MGLPIFITPVEPEEALKSVDKTAALSRSTIRRQRAARRSNHDPRPREQGTRRPFNPSAPPILPDQVPNFSDITNSSSSAAAQLDAARASVAQSRRIYESSRRLTQDISTLRHETDRMRDRHLSPLMTDGLAEPQDASSEAAQMPPVPESRDFGGDRRLAPHGLSEWAATRSWIEYRRSQNLQMASHPSLGRRETSTDLSAQISGTRLPALTPPNLTPPNLTPLNFSSSRRLTLEDSLDHLRSGSPPNQVFHSYPYGAPEPGPFLISVRSPSHDLRPPYRIERRSTAESQPRRRRVRPARLDGLGDRERSLSPDVDGAWETILATLTPDPQLPSAGSSFASTSAGNSTSSNVDSLSTSLTTVGSTHSPIDANNSGLDNVCDLVEDTQGSSDLTDTEGEDEDDLYELPDEHDSRGRFWRSYGNVVSSGADRVTRRHASYEADTLGGMQRIVRRLARREDIPDEWWAEVGLSRNFPRETVWS